jgi:hypothetical protein
MRSTFFPVIYICFLLVLPPACSQREPEEIQFAVSEGVLNAMDFSPLGIQRGDPIDSLRLYSLQGDSMYLSFNRREKPVLLISGGYTCDVTRGNMQLIDSLFSEFGEQVDIYLVNTLEAHPDDSPSPYSAEPEVWLAKTNIEARIAAPQPKTMEERSTLAEKWIKESDIKLPVLLDGPKNEFWNFAGQAPNMAVLVEEGHVVLKQSWFDYQEIKDVLVEGM